LYANEEEEPVAKLLLLAKHLLRPYLADTSWNTAWFLDLSSFLFLRDTLQSDAKSASISE
jgi:hypothetical protein